MTPDFKKGPGVGNRQENSTHEKIFKKSIRGGKLYSVFKKKEKKKRTCLKLSIRNYKPQANSNSKRFQLTPVMTISKKSTNYKC